MEQVQLAPVNLQELRQRRPAWEGSWPAQSQATRPRASPAAPAAREWATQQNQGFATQPGCDRAQQGCEAPDDSYQDSGRGRAPGSIVPPSSASLPSLEQQVITWPAFCWNMWANRAHVCQMMLKLGLAEEGCQAYRTHVASHGCCAPMA